MNGRAALSRRRHRAPWRFRFDDVQLGRRSFLRGAGGLALGLPWLEELAPRARAQASTLPRRVIVMTYEMGIPLGEWRPSQVGHDFTLPYVTAPLQPFQDRTLFISNIDNRVLERGGNEFVFGHPAKKEAALTGTLTTGAFPASNTDHVSEIRSDAVTDGESNGPSVEHLIGQFLRSGQPLPSVDLGIDGDALAPWGGQEPVSPSRFSFEGRANAISLNMHPSRVLDSLFAGITQDGQPSEQQVAMQAIRARNKSVLDAVRDSFDELSQGLGAEDRRRLEEHAARIRQLELDIQLTATCSVPAGIEARETIQGLRMDQITPLQSRILAHAMGCDLAPVGRIEYTHQQSPRFGIEALDTTLDNAGEMYDWHAMVHGDPLPGTTTFMRPGREEEGQVPPPYDPRLLDSYRFFVEQFAGLLAELDAIAEGPGTTALDNSLVILASDLGEGHGHGFMKMGYVLAGNLGGARTGYHFDAGPGDRPFELSVQHYFAESAYNVNQLLHSILDMAGVVDDTGGPMSMGLVGYLEQAGLPRRIDGLFA